MIVLATNKSIMRSKLLIMLFWVLISWSKCQPPDQIEFQSHDRKFNLLKKLNFDLMKFDLMIISLKKWDLKYSKHLNKKVHNWNFWFSFIFQSSLKLSLKWRTTFELIFSHFVHFFKQTSETLHFWPPDRLQAAKMFFSNYKNK